MLEPIFNGDVYIVGGGASLKSYDFSQLEGKKVIAINAAYRYCKPNILFTADPLFFKDHGYRLWKFKGQIITTAENFEHKNLTHIPFDKLWKEANSGVLAIFLAKMLGAKRVFLLGFDGQYTDNYKNFYSNEKVNDKTIRFSTLFENQKNTFNEASKELLKDDFKVINLNPDSKITCFFEPEAPATPETTVDAESAEETPQTKPRKKTRKAKNS